MLDIYQFKGNTNGPHLLILGAIHGNEIAGPQSLYPLIEQLKAGETSLDAGTLTIVPICNPKAHEADVRFVETNLNRTIKKINAPHTYEEKLAQDIIPLIEECDYVLDLHSTHVDGDPAFTFMNENIPETVAFAKAIGLETLFVGWEDIFEGEDFSTEAYAAHLNKPALTIECGYHKAAEATQIATNAIQNALSYLGLISGQNGEHTNHHIYRFKEKYICEVGDQFVKDWHHMDHVTKGSAIYTNAQGQEIRAPYDGYILIPDPHAHVGCELFYYGVLETL